MNERIENIFELVKNKLTEISGAYIQRAAEADKARGFRKKMQKTVTRADDPSPIGDTEFGERPGKGKGAQDKEAVDHWVQTRATKIGQKNLARKKKRQEAADKKERAATGKHTGADLDAIRASIRRADPKTGVRRQADSTEYEGPSLGEGSGGAKKLARKGLGGSARAKLRGSAGGDVDLKDPLKLSGPERITNIATLRRGGKESHSKGAYKKRLAQTAAQDEAAKHEGPSLMETKDWIQGAVKHPGRCTPMPNPDCPVGSPQYNLGKRFKKAARKKESKGGTGWQGKV